MTVSQTLLLFHRHWHCQYVTDSVTVQQILPLCHRHCQCVADTVTVSQTLSLRVDFDDCSLCPGLAQGTGIHFMIHVQCWSQCHCLLGSKVLQQHYIVHWLLRGKAHWYFVATVAPLSKKRLSMCCSRASMVYMCHFVWYYCTTSPLQLVPNGLQVPFPHPLFLGPPGPSKGSICHSWGLSLINSSKFVAPTEMMRIFSYF